jgi:uncharacterized membrane-anchored protein YitT (DUF2179 family)
MKKYLTIVLACFIIGLTYNMFFIPYNLVPSDIYGLGSLLSQICNLNSALFITICNIVLLLLSLPILGKTQTQKYLMPSFLIPLIIFLTQNISNYLNFDNIEIIIVVVFGAFLFGLAYSMIYKEGLSLGGFEIIQDIFNKMGSSQNKFIIYLLEFITIILSAIFINIEYAIYNLMIVLIVQYISTKTKLGISSHKTFFIITTKEKEVKDYLINDLKYDYTEFNVKGGFTNQKSKIIMTVIDTKDYYKLKEGISLIDSKAFISIIDNYETINKNISINETLKP